MHRKAALEATKQKITLNQYVIKAIDQALSDKTPAKETIIYIPAKIEGVDWNRDADEYLTTAYHDEPIWSKKENTTYAGN